MKTFLFSLIALSLAACNLAPKYARPKFDMPSNWRSQSDETSSANIAWWETLGDPVLNDLIKTALTNNNDLQIAMWRVNQYFAQYQIVRSDLFPQISANGSAVKERLPIDTDFLPSGFGPITADYKAILNLAYEIDFWGQVRNATFASYSEYLAQIENRRTVVLTLIGSVAQAYITLRQLDLELEISRMTEISRKESLQIATYRFEGGLTSEIEVEMQRSVYDEAVAAVQSYEMLVPQQENLLSILLGQSPDAILRGTPLEKLTLPNVATGTPTELLIRRPDVLSAEHKLIAANANIGVARAAFFPQFNFSAIFGYDSLQLNTLFNKSSKTWLIGGSLLQQIFTGGKLFGQLDLAKAQKQELLFQYEQTILNALKEVEDALIGLQQTKKIVLTHQDQVKALKEYLKLSWLRYYEGQTQYLTVLDAERHVYDAEILLAQAEGDQFLFLIDLYKALGGGWVTEVDASLTIEKTNANLDPSQD